MLRVVGTAAFLGFGLGALTSAIWKGQTWSMTLKEVFDGLGYALLTACTHSAGFGRTDWVLARLEGCGRKEGKRLEHFRGIS